MDKEVIGVYHSEEQAIRKVEELENHGLPPSNIFAVAKTEDDISMVRGKTNIDAKSTGGNWVDRFVGFLMGEEPVKEALQHAGLSGPEMDKYYRDIDNGAVLLYVDKEAAEINDEQIHHMDHEMNAADNLAPDSSAKVSHQMKRIKNNHPLDEKANMNGHIDSYMDEGKAVDTGRKNNELGNNSKLDEKLENRRTDVHENYLSTYEEKDER